MHYFQPYFSGILGKAVSIGGSGVHVFFFCSGFGLFMSYTKRKLGYLEFLKKRFLKIYIPYIVVVAVWCLFPTTFKADPFKTFLAHAFLYKMFMSLYEEMPVSAFWYMSTMFQFYFLFIPLARMKEKAGNKKFLSITCTLSVAWWIFTAVTGLNSERVWGSFFLQYLWEFAVGMVIAERLIQGKDIRIKKWILLFVGVVGIGLAGVLKIIGGPGEAVNDVFAACGYASIALLIYSFGANAVNGAFYWLSSISYEWYLLHMLVLTLVINMVGGGLSITVAAVPISLFVAWIYKKLTNGFYALRIKS